MAGERPRRYAFAYIAAGAVVLIDQITKSLALTRLSETEKVPLFGDFLGLQLAFNPGATLSFGSGATWLLTVLGLAVTAVLVVAAMRARTTGWAIGIGLVLGGAIGNLIDRLFAPPGFARGHVIDFLAYGNLFIGNLADVALGAGAIVLSMTLFLPRLTRRPRDAVDVHEVPMGAPTGGAA